MPKDNNQSRTDGLQFELRNEFGGGQRWANDISDIGQDNQWDNLNMDYDGNGGLVTRYGSEQALSITAGNHLGLGYFYSATTPQIIGFEDSAVFKFQGGTRTVITGYTPTSNTLVQTVQAGNKLYAVDGTLNMFYWDGSAWGENKAPDTNPAPTGCGLITSISSVGRLALTGKASEPGRIFFSNIHLNNLPQFDQSTWSIDNGNDGRPNTAHGSWVDTYYVVFKENSTSVIDCKLSAVTAAGFDKWTASSTIGCKAPNTVRMVGQRLFFLSNDGLRALSRSDSDTMFSVSDPLTDFLANVWNRVTIGSISKAHAVSYKTKYVLWLPLDGSTSCNYAVVWDTRLNNGAGGWLGVWSGWAATAMVKADMGSGERLYAGSTTKLLKYLDDVAVSSQTATTFKDAGVYYYSHTASGGFMLSEPYNDKRWKCGEVRYRLEKATSDGTLYAATNGYEYSSIRALDYAAGLTLPFTLPVTLPTSNNVLQPFSLISLDASNSLSLKVESSGGKLSVSNLWVAGVVNNIRKDNND